MATLQQEIARVISLGIQRKAVQTCSRWAEMYRVMGQPFSGPWKWLHHPWLKEMHDSVAEENIGMKSAQMGYTETLLNLAFFYLDIKQLSVLYLLPSMTPDASVFSSARFDPALELSPHLTTLFQDVRNVGHKRAGSANLYVRGTRSESGLKSVPAALLLFDELEEMDQKKIPLAEQRTAGQLEFMKWKISTPKLPDLGIDALFQTSTKENFFFKCPCCNRRIQLTFPENLEIVAKDHLDKEGLTKTRLFCTVCKGTLNHEEKIVFLSDGKWVAAKTQTEIRGFAINRLYSSAKEGRPEIIATKYLKSLINPWEEQEFWNSILGLPKIVKGARISDSEIQAVIGTYKGGQTARGQLVVMGIDVGTFFHYEIAKYKIIDGGTYDVNTNSLCTVLEQGKCKNVEDLDKLMRKHHVLVAVIDANPERRIAVDFAKRFQGSVYLCEYPRGINSKQMSVDEEESFVKVDRTSWLDISLGRIKTQRIVYPCDIDLEARTHFGNVVKVYEYDPDGNPIARYINGERPDHYVHARNYCEIALPLAYSQATNQNITSVTQG